MLNTYEKETDKTIVINMGNDKIETTENHLFFVKDNWWRAASNLKPGDLIETNNESCLVTEINVITTSKPIRVYNLNVDVNHNYYVGKNNCLVNNNCSQSQIDLYRSQSKSTISKFKSSIENSIDDIASQINKVYYRSEYEVRLELVGGFRHKIVINNEIPETLRIRFNEIIDEKLLEGAGQLKYIPTSGAKLVATPGNPGGFNVLNVPDELYVNPQQFWDEFNAPFLDKAIARGDSIIMATEPVGSALRDPISGALTGFGREYEYLKKAGNIYDEINKVMRLP